MIHRNMPGGGPWRILPECPSDLHNTLYAAAGRRVGRAACICPRGLAKAAAVRASARRKPWVPPSQAAPGMGRAGLPGSGPWRILPDCPARLHNSLYAARSRGGQDPCRCPRALIVMTAWRARPRKPQLVRRSVKLSAKAPELIGARAMFDARGGLCTIGAGVAIGRAGLTEAVTLDGMMARRIAQEQCWECPLLRDCRAEVLAHERPAGTWGGVWGGLDPWNRMGKKLVIIDGEIVAVSL